jgi:hypothetical protein
MTTASLDQFLPETWAREYARRFYKTDPGIQEIYFIPADESQREVRLIVVNQNLAERQADTEEATYVTHDRGGPDEHRVYFLDVTPTQWSHIESQQLPLPQGWSLADRKLMPRS